MYPVTSSRKNTPEKQTPKEIECEINRRVQKEMVRILNDISMSRQVAGAQKASQQMQIRRQEEATSQMNTEQTPHQSIPETGQSI